MSALVLMAVVMGAAPAGEAQARIEERARTEVNELFGALCPGRCLVLAVQARVDEEPVEVTPGFEPVAPAEKIAVVRSLSADVLVDAELPSELRGQIKGLVARRLRSVSPATRVEIQAVRFPPPRGAPAHAVAPPMPVAPAPAPPVVVPTAPRTLEARMTDRFVERAPEVLIAVTLAAAWVAAALVLARRKIARVPPARVAEALTEEAAPIGARFGAERRARLLEVLAEERSARNAVVREAIAQREGALVAAWAREVGGVLLEDLRGDPELGGGLTALTHGSPGAQIDPDVALHELELRLLSARLARPRGAAELSFGFLEAVRPEHFCTAWRGLSPGSQQTSLRFAPAPLKAALFESLAQGEREQLALAWARQPALDPDEAAAAAAELRRELERAEGTSSARGAIESLFEAMSMAEQDEVLTKLSAGGTWVGPVVVESTLAAAPTEALASALLELPPAELAVYLSGAGPALRGRLIAACPKVLRHELEEELRVRREVPREEFLAARRRLLLRLKDELRRRGLPRPAPPGRVDASSS